MSMFASFDGARKNLAGDFNALVNAMSPEELERHQDRLNNLRASVGSFLCMYDENQHPNDCHDLSESVVLEEININEQQ